MQAKTKSLTLAALLTLLLCGSLHAQLGFFNRDLPILSHRLHWNTSTNAWDSTYRFIADYDVNGRLVSRSMMELTPNGWVNTAKREVRYVGQGDSTITTFSWWVGGIWATYRVDIVTEDSQGRLTSELQYSDQGHGMFLQSGTRFIHGFDANGRLISREVMDYDNLTTNWVTSQLIQYQYNVGSSTPETAFTSLYTANGWRPFYRDLNLQWYNFDRFKAKTYTRQSWDGSAYVNIERYDCTFGRYDYKRCTTDRWESNAWVPYLREKTLVDTAGHYIEQGLDQYEAGAWRNNWWTKFTNTYNGYYLAESEAIDSSATIGQHNVRYKYVFINYALSKPAIAEDKPLIAYPQPARDRLYLHNDLRGPVRLRVIDLQGRELMALSQDAIRLAEGGIDVSQLPDGIYLLQVHHSKSAHTVRFQVQH